MHWFPERQGGLDRVYYELTRALPKNGAVVFGLVAGSESIEVETQGAIRCFASRDASLLGRWIGMRRVFSAMIKENNFDLVVSHFALYSLPVLDMITPRPLVIHFHGPWADEGAVEGNNKIRQSLKRWLERLVYSRASRAIVLSTAFAELLVTRYGYPRDRIHIIPGGIDAERFSITVSRNEARTRLNWPKERPTIVAVRRLVARMGLENLIAATAIVRRNIPDIMVMIAGRGVLRDQLSKQIETLGLCENVSLIGFVSDDDLPYVYRAADLSVVPTISLEGFGLIAAESLAAGTPCLVSPIGGLPEVVLGLSDNLVLKSPAASDIAHAITEAIQGRLKLPTDDCCRNYARERFDWNIIAAQVAEVYRQVLR